MCKQEETLNEIMKVDCDKVLFYNKESLAQYHGDITNFMEAEYPDGNWMELANESDELSNKYLVLNCATAEVIKIIITNGGKK